MGITYEKTYCHIQANFNSYNYNQKLLQRECSMQNPITLEQQRKVWTIHQSVNGITYYYNRSTKKSQYEMPECFKITEQDLEHPDWKEYRTAEGKKFYYNALTRRSCWHMPVEVKEWKLKIQDQKRAEKQKNGNKQQQPLSETDEIKKKFMNLFKTKQINTNTKWDVCIKLCQDDDRWNLLKMADKKKYFLEYISELKKISELEQKAKTEANRIQFIKMLRQKDKLTSDSKMHRVQFDFITDPRWRLLDGIDRENAFQDYLDELVIKEKQQARIERERNIQNLKILMESQEVPYNMKWDQFRNQFHNYECYKKLNDLDRINTFSKYIMQAEERNLQKEKKDRRMKQRTDRMQFRKMIQTKLFNGDINYKAKWRAFVKEFKDDVRLLNMMDPEHKGSSAHEIFQNFMEWIRRNHKNFKSEIKAHFKKNNFRMTQETSFSQFSSKLADLQLFTQAKPVYREYFYNYFKQKIKIKNAAKQEKEKQKQRQKLAAIKKNQRREKKAIFKIFKQYSQNTKSKYGISDHIEKIEQNLSELNIIISRENIFKYYLAYLDEADGDQDKKSKDSQKSEKPKSKSKEKQRSSSSSRSKSERRRKKRKDEDKDRQREKERQRERERDSYKQKEKILKQTKNIAPTLPVTKSIAIPNQLRQKNNENDIQEQGQIKDDDEVMIPEVNNNNNSSHKEIEKQKQKPKQNEKEKEKEKERSHSLSRERRRKKSSKKRRGSSSSDSD